MRIAIFTETYLPDINGVVTHIKILRDGLIAAGHEVIVVTADAKVQKCCIEDGVLKCPGIHTKKIYNYSLSSPVSIRRMSLIRMFNPDVIHIHNEFGIGFSGAVMAKLLRIPYVYTLHTMYDDYIYYVAKRAIAPIVRDASHVYLKLLAKHASAITGPSKKVETFLKNECGIDRHVYCIPNPVELESFSPNEENKKLAMEYFNSLNIPKDSTLCCFCGRLGKEKSVDVLLDFWGKSCKEDKNLFLCIFGEGPVREELIEQARSLGIEENVIFPGKVDHEELPSRLLACKIYITTSLSDTYSISMLEAMAVGLPVLTIQDPENEGQIINGENGFIFADADEMYSQICKIRSMSEQEYTDFTEKIIKRTKNNSASSLADTLINIYYDAIGNKQEKREVRRFRIRGKSISALTLKRRR